MQATQSSIIYFSNVFILVILAMHLAYVKRKKKGGGSRVVQVGLHIHIVTIYNLHIQSPRVLPLEQFSSKLLNAAFLLLLVIFLLGVTDLSTAGFWKIDLCASILLYRAQSTLVFQQGRKKITITCK